MMLHNKYETCDLALQTTNDFYVFSILVYMKLMTTDRVSANLTTGK